MKRIFWFFHQQFIKQKIRRYMATKQFRQLGEAVQSLIPTTKRHAKSKK